MMKQLTLLALCATLVTCAPKYQSLSLEEFESAIQDTNVVIVDVRTPEEYLMNHIDGAINMDWKNESFAQQCLEQIPNKKQPIALYCIYAKRSKQAAECLNKMGYKHVMELGDGFDKWMKVGKPFIQTTFCQSCGMPLSEEVLGTNADGSPNTEYCSFCYLNGEYTNDLSMTEMINVCVEYLDAYNAHTQQNLTKEEYSQMLHQYFPTLKRWKGR